MKSLNAELLIAAKRQRIKTIGLSATLAQSPLQMRALGYSLDLHNDKTDELVPGVYGHKLKKPNFYKWSSAYGCRRDPRFKGWKWFASAANQIEIMANLNAQIFPDRGVRVRCDDIPGFPEQDITAELYDIDEPEKLQLLYADMAEALRLLEGQMDRDVARGTAESPLVRVLRARQRIELLKVSLAVELTQDSLEKGQSVGLFVNFKQTIEELAKRLGSPFIDGTVTGAERQRLIDQFQSNQLRCLVLNSAAGGISISLHDLTGQFPRVGYIMPGFNATEFKQVCGRFRREGGKSRSHFRVLLAANTIETQIYRSLKNKLNNLDSLNDRDLIPDNLPVTRHAM